MRYIIAAVEPPLGRKSDKRNHSRKDAIGWEEIAAVVERNISGFD